jgi:hypothetical protein
MIRNSTPRGTINFSGNRILCPKKHIERFAGERGSILIPVPEMHKDTKNIILPKDVFTVIENDIGDIPVGFGYPQNGIGTGTLPPAVMNNKIPGHPPGITLGIVKFDLIKFNMIEFTEFSIYKEIPYCCQLVETGTAQQGASPAGHERHEIFPPKINIRQNFVTLRRNASEFLRNLSRSPASLFLSKKA